MSEEEIDYSSFTTILFICSKCRGHKKMEGEDHAWPHNKCVISEWDYSPVIN